MIFGLLEFVVYYEVIVGVDVGDYKKIDEVEKRKEVELIERFGEENGRREC